MTTKQIAELCNVNESTVLRWAKKAAEKTPSIRQKLEASGHGTPALFSLEETIATVETGRGATYSALLQENAALKLQSPDGKMQAGHTDDRLGRLETMVAALVGAVAEIVPVLRGASPPARPAQSALPPPAELWPRDALRKIVDGWARSHGRDFQGAWAGLYREYGYRYHRDIVRAAKNRGQPVLDYADAENILGELLALAYFLYGQKEPASCAV